MEIKQLTKKQLEWKYIQDLIFRKNAEVIEIMKKIPSHELFGYKGELNEKR
jgi:hypothetical protein